MQCHRFATLVLGSTLAATMPSTADAEERRQQAERLRQAALLVRAEFALEALGYGIDPPDGLPDDRTRAALRHFGRGAGLPGPAPVSQTLVAALEAAAVVLAAERAALAMGRRDAEERLVRADLAAKARRSLPRTSEPRQEGQQLLPVRVGQREEAAAAGRRLAVVPGDGVAQARCPAVVQEGGALAQTP